MPVLEPDTHNLAAQASAYKLIKLLHGAYPDIGLLGSPDSPAKAAQGSLLQYLEQLIKPSAAMTEEERALAKKTSSIKGTLQFIDYVNRLPSERLTLEDKKMIVEQTMAIASLYPGGVWDTDQEDWSINRFYNKATGAVEEMMTSPAEALNLVCTALFDETRYLTAEGSWEHDLDLRITTVYKDLLHLRKQIISGSLEKCSAGLQHDVLYFLNRAYLDKIASEGGKPIEMLMETGSFLLGSLSAFVMEHIIERRADSSTNEMLLAWVCWEAKRAEDDIEHPMMVWLQGIIASPEIACIDYLKSRCEEFGLNPRDSRIPEYAAALQSIPVVLPQAGILPLIADIMRMDVLAIPPTNPVSQGPDSIYDLIKLRNSALVQFKEQARHLTMQTAIEPISDLFRALTYVDSLYRYRDLTMLVGVDDGQFEATRSALKDMLQNYFTDYSLDKRIPSEEFDARCSSYVAAHAFLNQSNVGFIENFFAVALTDDDKKKNWDKAWASLEALRGGMDRLHPLILSDEALRDWHRQSESISADGSAVVDITPYAINRLLLHGLLLPANEWSPLYCEYLALVTDWLLRPSALGEGLLTQLKKSYSSCLLSNLEFMALVKGSAVEDGVKECLFRVVESLTPFMLSNDKNLFIDFFHLPPIELDEKQRAQIWTVVKGRLGVLIQDGYQLAKLFTHLTHGTN